MVFLSDAGNAPDRYKYHAILESFVANKLANPNISLYCDKPFTRDGESGLLVFLADGGKNINIVAENLI